MRRDGEMATVQWGSSDTNPNFDCECPRAAKCTRHRRNGGAEFGVAGVEDGTITVKFFDE